MVVHGACWRAGLIALMLGPLLLGGCLAEDEPIGDSAEDINAYLASLPHVTFDGPVNFDLNQSVATLVHVTTPLEPRAGSFVSGGVAAIIPVEMVVEAATGCDAIPEWTYHSYSGLSGSTGSAYGTGMMPGWYHVFLYGSQPGRWGLLMDHPGAVTEDVPHVWLPDNDPFVHGLNLTDSAPAEAGRAVVELEAPAGTEATMWFTFGSHAVVDTTLVPNPAIQYREELVLGDGCAGATYTSRPLEPVTSGGLVADAAAGEPLHLTASFSSDDALQPYALVAEAIWVGVDSVGAAASRSPS